MAVLSLLSSQGSDLHYKESTMAIKTEPTEIVLSEQRRQLIAEAAYYRAESRGFVGGDPLQDWLDSEAEIDLLLSEYEAAPTTERDTLVQRLESILHECDRRFEEFTATAKDTRHKLGHEWHEQLAGLAEKLTQARHKLATLRLQSIETWHEVRDHTIHLYDDLQATVERIATRLKQGVGVDSKRKEAG
jgi:Protein of unknown function (DUF2934)